MSYCKDYIKYICYRVFPTKLSVPRAKVLKTREFKSKYMKKGP